MKITIVAATKLEIEYLLVHFRAKKTDFAGLFVIFNIANKIIGINSKSL
jgi:hypothetical protein